MSGVLAWVKANILIVICAAVALVLPPVAFVFSSMWNSSIREAQQEEFQNEQRRIRAKERVTYTLPAVFEGEQPIEESRPPNDAVTELFRREREARLAQLEAVRTSALEFNRREHGPLIDGLFPSAADDRTRRRLLLDLERMVAGDGGRSVFAALFDRINAGRPADPDTLETIVEDMRQRERDRLIPAGSSQRLTSEQEEEIREQLTARRLAEYARRASDISVYAGVDTLYGADPERHSVLPRRVGDDRPDDVTAFTWNFDYWVVSDVLEAVRLANTGPAGETTTVPESVVKRIESVRIAMLPRVEAGTDDTGADDFGFQPPGRGGPARGTGDGARTVETHTGRRTSADNDVYDVRHVELTAVVSSERLPALIDALARTNFMTVTDLDVSEVDVWGDLAAGYFYGPEHVVRARIQVETVWLREWTKPLMPQAVRERLGVRADGGDGFGGEG